MVSVNNAPDGVAVAVGLGNMGMAISLRLHECGWPVVAVDLDDGRRADWQLVTGKQALASVRDVDWRVVERVFLQVRLTEEARNVLVELRNLPLRMGTRIFVVTTLEVGFARRLGDYQIDGTSLFELPVSGADVRARNGELTVLTTDDISKADESFLIDTIAARVVRFRSYGEPALAKLLNNAVAGYNVRTLCEIFHLADRLGLNARQLYEVILSASGSSFVATILPELVDDLLDKDIRLLEDFAQGLPTVSINADSAFRQRLSDTRRLLLSMSEERT
jgi:3-hydroxyisobutyrate dehydrogenase-like beta-hydroxyacid dehydrogenase